MKDLIDRQTAIDAFVKEYPMNWNNTDAEIAEQNAWRDAKCIIENLPSVQPEQHWIPCSERYPDMDERVLVYTVAHDYHVWDCMSNRADNYFWEDEEGLYHNKYEADLWLPLPEPWRGEQ